MINNAVSLYYTDLPEAEAAELENKLKVLNTIDQEVGTEPFFNCKQELGLKVVLSNSNIYVISLSILL